jgi:Ceramidase
LNSIQKGAILIGLSVLATAGVFLLPAIPQSTAYHHFADTRRILAIPNFWNVVSNLPFVVFGLLGLRAVSKAKITGWTPAIYGVLFIGVLLTGFGSAFYHLSPTNDTLVWDRLPLTIVFMAFLTAVVAEWINKRVGFTLFIPFVLIGIASVWWWHHTEVLGRGDLRLYGLVQFYPTIFIPLIIIFYYSSAQKTSLRLFLSIVLWYLLAKAFETLDSQIFRYFPLSGHTLKHFAAAISTYYFIPLFARKYAAGSTPPAADIP